MGTRENLKRLRQLIREALTPKERHMDPKSNAKLAGIMKSLGLNPPGVKKATATVDRESLSAFVERTLGAELPAWGRELLDRTAAELERNGRGLRATVEVTPLRALTQAQLLEAQGFSKAMRPSSRRGRPMMGIVDEPAGLQALEPASRERLAIALHRHAPGPVKLTVLKKRADDAPEIVWDSPPCAHFARSSPRPPSTPTDPATLKPDDRIMVLWDDSAGLPRAWATGTVRALDDVKRVARGQLVAYVTKKKALGEPISTSDFTERLELVDPKAGG